MRRRPAPPPGNFIGLVATTVAIDGSTISGPLCAVLLGGQEAAGGQTIQDAECFSAPGIVWRPRAPSSITADRQTYEVGTEAIGVRIGENVVPIAFRDLRFNFAYPDPLDGTVALVGYGGGCVEFIDTAALETKARIRVPYSNGTKELLIELDPEEDKITIQHNSGATVEFTDGAISVEATTSITVNAPQVLLGSSPGNPAARVGDLVSVAVPAMTCGGVPVIPVNPALATTTGGVQGMGQIISGKSGILQ